MSFTQVQRPLTINKNKIKIFTLQNIKFTTNIHKYNDN
jgi:hypothetical protein